MREAEVIPIDVDKDKVEDNKNKRYTGKIHNLREGYGFITTPDIKFRMIFFYWTSLDKFGPKFEELTIGSTVEFEAHEYIDKYTNRNMGYRAYHIKVIKIKEKR